MTKDEIIRMAREAGWDMDGIFNDVFGFGVRLERFANLVAKHERKTCADAAAELLRLHHNNLVLTNALWKACADDEEVVNATIESQGELK